jgi:hypothetical protein
LQFPVKVKEIITENEPYWPLTDRRIHYLLLNARPLKHDKKPESKYQNAMEKWRKDIGTWAIAKFSKAENIRTNYRSWNKTMNVDFDLVVDEKDFPAEPERNFEQMNIHTYRDMKDEISNAIRILKMTDEETVSTSTYNSIAKYL